MARFSLDNRFDAPPEYVQKWLCDYRPDDGQRFFEEKGPPATVTKKGDQIVRENDSPMGRQVTIITIESPTRWVAKGDMKKAGKVTATFQITETVRPDGKGSLHHVEGTMEGQTLPTRVMLAFGMPMMKRDLKKAFGRMKAEIEAAHKAGKPPTA